MDFTILKDNLIKNGFWVSCFETAKDATEYLCKEINGKTVGIGGSMTVLDMGLYEKLVDKNKILWHWKEQGKEIYTLAQTSDIYISSVNAIAETGEIVNIDGTCNRVSAIMYGHEKVYLIIGKNKIEKTYEKALWRARNVAAPLNAKRLNRATPCAENADKCYDCNSPERICRGISVLLKKPGACEYEVILINENLGY